MKRILAAIGWLIFASASFGADGQHTGVGGNPFVPPPNPQGMGLPPWQTQMLLTPGLIFVTPPEFTNPDAPETGEASGREANEDQDKGESGSAQ